MSVDWIARARALNPTVRNFLAGRWESGTDKELIEKYSPRDGRLLFKFGAGSVEDVNRAVASARDAYRDGRWAKLAVQRRKRVLFRLAELIDEHAEELALMECLDVGKPISDALGFDVPFAAEYIRFNAEAADKIYGPVYAVDPSSLSYQLHRPMGVVAAIIGWNFPLVLAAQKIGPALATGNSLVLKPSELTSLSASRIAELGIEAGIPEGVFNVVHGGASIGAALASHDDVDLLSFTGSSRTGKGLLVAAGRSNMKRLLLECGGKAPNIVFDDSPNLSAVADGIAARAYRNQGQVCTASSRLLIQEAVKEELLGLVIKNAAAFSPGDPLLSETRFGAVVSQEHRAKIQSYIASGLAQGARVAYEAPGQGPFADGYYVAPVIFDGVAPTLKIAQEEIFGPVLSTITFRDEEEAIDIANGTMYGLSAIIWTKNLGRAHRVSQRINAGWVAVNATDRPSAGPGAGVLSIGGHKESGIGAEGGVEGLGDYMSKTAVQLFC